MIPAQRLKPLKELRKVVVFKYFKSSTEEKWTMIACNENFERARELDAEGCEVFVCDNTRNMDTLVEQYVKLTPMEGSYAPDMRSYLHKFLEFICY